MATLFVEALSLILASRLVDRTPKLVDNTHMSSLAISSPDNDLENPDKALFNFEIRRNKS